MLQRSLGVNGAVGLGLGSILGTGVFVSIGLAADVVGAWVVLATVLAALLATANALSSAQLAAAHPVSGGTYEYGYRLLRPSLGFAAGWMFLCAKSASAATAALGFAGYAIALVQDSGPESSTPDTWRLGIALVAILALTVLVLTGLKRSSLANSIIVAVTISTLVLFVIVGAAHDPGTPAEPVQANVAPGPVGLLEATALMFVAFTGYGRIATLGEEVARPERTIPRAIIVTLVVSATIYITVALVAVRALGASDLGRLTIETGAPLEAAAHAIGHPWLALVIAVGAMTAMLGVLLNLILGLSRVLLAMGRRDDMPALFGRVDDAGRTPGPATIAVGLVIAIIASSGSIQFAWSFSACTVLVYYAITNMAALRLPESDRRFPRWIAWAGLVTCLALAWWVEPRAWILGLALLAVGFVLRAICRRSSTGRLPTLP